MRAGAVFVEQTYLFFHELNDRAFPFVCTVSFRFIVPLFIFFPLDSLTTSCSFNFFCHRAGTRVSASCSSVQRFPREIKRLRAHVPPRSVFLDTLVNFVPVNPFLYTLQNTYFHAPFSEHLVCHHVAPNQASLFSILPRSSNFPPKPYARIPRNNGSLVEPQIHPFPTPGPFVHRFRQKLYLCG